MEKIATGNFIHANVIATDPADPLNPVVYGFLRLPNEAYLKFLRQRIQGK